MVLTTDIQEANSLLKLYTGASVDISIYSSSLKRLALKLSLTNDQKVICLVAISCKHITGFFHFKDANLSIHTQIDPNTDDTITIIRDHINGFELNSSGGFTLAYGNVSEFGTSFENFLKD